MEGTDLARETSDEPMMRLDGLRRSREMRLYTAGELGRLVKMRAWEIVKIERGERWVRMETAVRFSQVLRVGLHDLRESPEDRAAQARDMHAPSRHPTDIVLSCFDRAGRNVTATLGRWEDHIEAEHPEVGGHFEAVQVTIQSPDFVMRDVAYPDGENSYRKGAPPGYPEKYLKVCVGYGPANFSGTIIGGWVVTAYPTGKIKRGEQLLWSA